VSQQINLYNPEFAPKRDLTSLSALAIAWGLAILVVTGAILTTTVRLNDVKYELVQEAQARQVAQAEMTRYATQLSARKPDLELASELTRLEHGLASRAEVMNTLHAGVIGDVRGFSEHLEAFARQTISGLWLTGLKVSSAGQDIVIEGRATQPELVPGYVKRLNREKIMQGHAFSELEMRRPESSAGAKRKTNQKYIEFRLSTLPVVGTAGSKGRR
jgi:hypothetical protein